MDRGMEREGVGLVKFVKWVEDGVGRGGEREMSIDKKVDGFGGGEGV